MVTSSSIEGQLGTQTVGCSLVPTMAMAIAASHCLPGQDMSVAGFMGAMHGAFMCAGAVLKRNIYIDLMWLKRRTDAAKSTKKD